MSIYSQLSAVTTGSPAVISKQTAAASSALTFTTGISTAYNIYYLEYYGVTVTSNSADILLQISTNGGSSYLTTGYTQNGQYNTTGSLGAFNIGLAGNILVYTQDSGTTLPGCGNCRMYNFNSTTFQKQFYTVFSGSSGGVNLTGTSICLNTDTAVVNAVQIVPTAGTFSGVFILYGIVGS
jgi:hypothetical protein